MTNPFKPLWTAVSAAAILVSTAPSAFAAAAATDHAAMTNADAKTNQYWWPNSLDLSGLRRSAPQSNPLGGDFDYAAAFESLDLEAVKADIETVMTTSQDWWPADYGNYGPLFIRMAWHSAGTYRVTDGRGGAGGGQQRFAPLDSWPDNANLDKARRLLWPVKQKYGAAISWADLMVLAGNQAMEQMGFKTLGFAGGRADVFEPEIVYWGPESELLASDRRDANGELQKPLGATVMGLIYVNPEGPNANLDPVSAGAAIRESFGLMAMNDAETVALIAGGHAFGKVHGAHRPDDCVGAEPAAAPIENQGLGWKNTCGTGKGADTTTSGLEGAWTATPVRWSTQYLDNLFNYEWVKQKSPGGGTVWVPADAEATTFVPDAFDPTTFHQPIMLTTDLALKEDPIYREISNRFRQNPEEFEATFAQAWFKLIHRDMGPRARYLGSDVPEQAFAWQDPVPAVDHRLITERDARKLKERILESGLTTSDLVRTAWASAVTYRDTDMRGGANGARIRLAPQKDWAVNDPDALARVLSALETIQSDFNGDRDGGKKVSMADLIVLGGAAAIEKAAADAGFDVDVPFAPGRTDATADMTDTESFAVLEPKADGFRNYVGPDVAGSPAAHLVERADLLGLTVPEMTVLVGGMRVLDANAGGADHGVFTERPGVLSNDFFVNLLSMETEWTKADEAGVYEGRDRGTGDLKWTATDVDLVFGANAELRAVSEVYAFEDAQEAFVDDFVDAWVRVMRADRFDLNQG